MKRQIKKCQKQAELPATHTIKLFGEQMEFDQALIGKCILAAEDNEVNQIVLEHTLAEQPIPFVMANNGEEAITAWQRLKPLLILMDISMPVINGFQAIEAIRTVEAEQGLHTPIIALTAHALKGDKERCLEAGADLYMSKPINPTQLLEQIDWLLKHKSESAVA